MDTSQNEQLCHLYFDSTQDLVEASEVYSRTIRVPQTP